MIVYVVAIYRFYTHFIVFPDYLIKLLLSYFMPYDYHFYVQTNKLIKG